MHLLFIDSCAPLGVFYNPMLYYNIDNSHQMHYYGIW